MWIGTGIVLLLLIPVWQGWAWQGPMWLQVIGGVGVLLSVAVGWWACGQMGWARVLFAPALFPQGQGAHENRLPQRLVVSGPYRYVRNPLYSTDMTVMLSTALLTQHWLVVVTLIAYIAQLIMQLRLEERELKQRFGAAYERYLQRVPRFIPRLTPVDPREIYGK
jgi:protein-S-isoprenylcysteine O-methyltransferase Ste14